MARVWVRALAIGAAVTLLASGCASSDEDAADATPQDVASGVVLDADGAPVSGVEVELLVWPAAQRSTTTPAGEPTEGPQLISADTDTTDAKGAFDLEALTADLSPHASADGLVGIAVRVPDVKGASTHATIQLQRAADTGVVSVIGTDDVVVVTGEGGAVGTATD